MKASLVYFLILVIVLRFRFSSGELEFYPDFRRLDPAVIKWEKEQAAEQAALDQFSHYLQQEQQKLQLQQRLQRESDFSYTIPTAVANPEFAIAPPDPRYYQQDDEEYMGNDFEPEEQQNEGQESGLLQYQKYKQIEPNLFQQQEYFQQEAAPGQPEEQLFPYTNVQIPLRQQELQEEEPIRSNGLYEREDIPAEKIAVDTQGRLNNDDVLKDQKLPSLKANEDTHAVQEPTNKIQQIPKTHKPLLVKTRTDGNWPLSGLYSIRDHQLMEQNDQSVDISPVKSTLQDETAGVYIIAVVAGISAAATVGLIAFAIGWYNLQKNVKNASDVEYPAYGVTGPNKDVSPTGDRRLAQSAQMYHYQHQKQQIIAMESRAAATVRHGSMSEAESDEENEEGDYTVYECPGLAPTGEMEVKNPLFQDDPTPASQPASKVEETVQNQQK